VEGKLKKILILLLLVLSTFLSGCDLIDKVFGSNGDSEFASTIKKSGIGYSIDVVTSSYVDVEAIKRNTPVFNEKELGKLSLYQTDTLKSNSGEFSASSMQEISSKVNSEYYGSVSVSGRYGLFTSSLSANFKGSSSVTTTQKKSQYYYMLYQTVAAKTLELPGYGDLENYTKILSSSLLSDLEEMKNNEFTSEQFISKYGTHVIMAGIYGGKVEAYYTAFSSEYHKAETYASAVDAVVKAGIAGVVKGKVEGGSSSESEFKSTYTNSQTNFSAHSIGGNVFASATLDSFASEYPAWAEGFNSSDSDSSVLIGIPANGLVALWDLFPDKYSNEKTELETFFNQYAERNYNEFLKDYKSNLFSSGSGIKSDPYIVLTQSEFEEMKNFPGSYFKLGNDIELSQYIAFDFTGGLDGDNHTISGINFNHTSTTAPTETKYYGGVFNTLKEGTEIKNLNLTGSYNVSENNNGSNWIHGGLLAATNEGVIKNVKVFDSTLNMYRDRAALGAITGSNIGIIEDCYVLNTNLTGNSETGGITARNYSGGIVNNCKVENAILKNKVVNIKRATGGIVGFNEGTAKVESCQAIKVHLQNIGIYNVPNYEATPQMGYIIGYNLRNGSMSYCTISECSVNYGSLKIVAFPFFVDQRRSVCTVHSGMIGQNEGTIFS